MTGSTLETPSALTPLRVRCRAVRALSKPRQRAPLSRLRQETDSGRTGQGKAAAEPEAINSGPEPPRPAPQEKQAKEVFEMAASLFIEEESGTYTAVPAPAQRLLRRRLLPDSRSGSELRVSYADRA